MKYLIILAFFLIFIGCGSNESNTAAPDLPEPGNTETETGTVTDIDGNVYKTVKIGNQWWMAENLKVKHDPEGNSIEYYHVNSDPGLDEEYGLLYTGTTATLGSTEESVQGIAPDGWHIPSMAEWRELFNSVGGQNLAGIALKQSGGSNWRTPNNGTDNFEFTALPGGGYIVPNGPSHGYPFAVHFWSSTGNNTNADMPSIMNDTEDVYILNESRAGNALSVRCVKDL